MKKNAIATASLADYAAVINDEHRAAYGCAQEAIEHARVAGEHLLKAKAALKHGEWLPWLAANVDVGERQARRYMAVAENWAAISVKSDFKSDLTLAGALDALAKATPKAEQKQAPEPPKSVPVTDLPSGQEPQSAAAADLPAEHEPFAESQAAPAKSVEAEERKPPKVIQADAETLLAQVEALKAELKVAYEKLEMMTDDNEALLAEVKSLQFVQESNDQVKAALAEAKKFREINRVLEERNRGFQNEKNEAIRSAKSWQRQYEKARKAA